jgi:hypothetical protein
MKHVLKHLPDALMVSGGGSVAFGAGLIYMPAGFIVGGLLAVVAGYMVARAS